MKNKNEEREREKKEGGIYNHTRKASPMSGNSYLDGPRPLVHHFNYFHLK